MTPPRNIIGMAEMFRGWEVPDRKRDSNMARTILFAQALLDREEKLKIAVEVMETLRANPTMYIDEQQRIIKEAFSRIKAL